MLQKTALSRPDGAENNPTDYPQRLAVALSAGFFAVSVVASFLEILSSTELWDLDHEIYFGQELIRGNLIWTSEFHDKLPPVQFLFLIPAAFGSLVAWKIQVFLIMVLSVVVVLRLLPPILHSFGYSHSKSRAVSLLASSCFMLVSVTMPGGMSQINSAASSLAMVSLCLTLSVLIREIPLALFVGISFCSGLAAALSVSVRPYFVLPLTLAYVWTVSRYLRPEGRKRSSERLRALILLGAPVFLGFFINVGPYLLGQKLDSFLSGINLLAQPLQSKSSFADYLSFLGLTSLVWQVWLLGMLSVCAVLLLLLLIRRLNLLVYLVIPMSALSLAAVILTQHFWPHYVNLFSWYFAVLAATALYSLISIDPDEPPSSKQRLGSRRLSLLLVVLLTIGASVGVLPRKAADALSEHPSLAQTIEIRDFLSDLEGPRPNFLVPQNMFAHWQLGESRHGFPHASNVGHIMNGQWVEVEGTFGFDVPRDLGELCEALLDGRVQLVVLSPDSGLGSCFDGQNKEWERVDRVLSSGKSSVFWKKTENE